MSKQIKVGDVVAFIFEVKEIHEGYKTLRLSDSTWVGMERVEKLNDEKALLWKLENN